MICTRVLPGSARRVFSCVVTVADRLKEFAANELNSSPLRQLIRGIK